MMAGDGHTDPEDPVLVKAAEAGGEFAMLCLELIEKRRQDGSTDDIIGILTHAYDEGELARADGTTGTPEELAAFADQQMTSDDLLMFLILLVVAGNETTRNALSGGLRALSQFPEERDRLAAHPEMSDLAVDEIIRFVSPVLSFIRTVTEDHTYQGVDLKAGGCSCSTSRPTATRTCSTSPTG